MLRLKSKSHGAGLLMLVAVTCTGHAAERRQQQIDVCIAAAKEHHEIFRLDDKVAESRCECARNQRHGRLPSTSDGWKNAGEGSATLAMVECAKSEIISFYSGAMLKLEMASLEERGLAQDDREVQKAEDLSACVGEGSYNEIRRVARSDGSQNAEFAKQAFRKMYGRCKLAANQLK